MRAVGGGGRSKYGCCMIIIIIIGGGGLHKYVLFYHTKRAVGGGGLHKYASCMIIIITLYNHNNVSCVMCMLHDNDNVCLTPSHLGGGGA